MEIYTITEPTTTPVPIIISSPHSGTAFPEDIRAQYKKEAVDNPDDTDWFIDRLYDFAPSMGIKMISANYSRWVIDLNRDPESKPLYNDGRVITALTPETDFNGNSIYVGSTPDSEEVSRRIKTYYQPYHAKIAGMLAEYQAKFGRVLLFDAHSIRKVVPGIRSEAFPDLILGDNDETSCSKELIDIAYNALSTADYELMHNHPFKGGYITRSFGDPTQNIHALQLEMAKTNYMNDDETEYHEERAAAIRKVLQGVFNNLIEKI
ncbi:N-formylglutamate amidohydrolase [Robertkochia solimangrovi]|uniref:N-formylglutamate amidohydrolase n=1 Tax=Robertkochia solimangrovi TaxID=2213046 RepID=UPI00117CF4A0|nr:N-formylglutamate amidohydrolase [Robertkochia solimangrovi]TRZ43755.1 N-formylglutamate deformylase [Robertkochia solimangrovi]